jgi:signal transduction histidine kinase
LNQDDGVPTMNVRAGGVRVSISARDLRAPLNWTVAGLGALDIAVAVILSGYAVALVGGVIHTSHPHGGAAASVGVLAMTLPVAWRRPAPLAAAAVMGAAALLNGLVFGPMVRCGACLPAVFLVAFAVGVRRDRAWSAAGLLLCAVAVVAEGLYDPQIEGAGLVAVLPVLAAFFVSGRVVRARTRTAAELRKSSAELRRQRAETARLAVLADRARLTAELEKTLHAQIGGLASIAADGLGALAGDPAGDQATARQALASIERDGRAVLGHLREVLGTLQERPPSEPQPTLARLSELLAQATTADARLTVDGHPRTLPSGLELSGYRIVEHLLLALEDAPEAAVDVRLSFTPDALELHVSGPPAANVDLRAVLAAARERAGLHGGTVDSRLAGGVCYAMARLPLVSGHA